jgi:squalene synthase HpnC
MNIHYSDLATVYADAERFASSHYENFPVVSRFLSKKIRPHIALIYKFARTADDIADEGKVEKSKRLSDLHDYEYELTKSLEGETDKPFWSALKRTIDEFGLSSLNFYNLLKAFKQDVIKNRYSNFNEVLEYCENSANPVGRLVLELHGIRDQEAFYYSDKICTALQITNFYQDISIDLDRDRIYLPLDEMEKYCVDESMLRSKRAGKEFKELMRFQTERAFLLYKEGRGLIKMLPSNIKHQIKWTLLGGEEILNKIQKIKFDVLNQRPKLTKYDYFRLMIKSLYE